MTRIFIINQHKGGVGKTILVRALAEAFEDAPRASKTMGRPRKDFAGKPIGKPTEKLTLAAQRQLPRKG